MKKILLFSSLAAFSLCGKMTAQTDTLLWADFETDPAAYIINNYPPPSSTDTAWYNWDNDLQADGSGSGRPLEWFWTAGFSDLDSASGVFGSNSWTNTSTPTDNWLITKSIMITDTNAVLSWKSAPYQTPRYLDGYQVLISTLTNDLADFTDTIFEAAEYQGIGGGDPFDYATYTFSNGFVHGQDGTYTLLDPSSDSSRLVGVLRPFSVSLSAYAGQKVFIAFHHNSTDDNLLSLDDILVLGTNNVGISKHESNVSFNAFPNPATDKVNIALSLKSSEALQVSLIDISGRVIMSEQLGTVNAGKFTHSLDLKGIAAGLYTLQLSGASGTVSSKLDVK